MNADLFLRSAVSSGALTQAAADLCARLYKENPRAGSIAELVVGRGLMKPPQALAAVERLISGGAAKIPGCELQKLLSRTPCGFLYRGKQTAVGRAVAVRIWPRCLVGEQTIQRILGSIRAAAKANHPKIVQTIDARDAGSFGYLLTEYLQGEPLQKRLASPEPLSENEALRVAVDCAEALGAAHKAGVVHGDLRPDKVIIGPEGEAKVTGFGCGLTQAEAAVSAAVMGHGRRPEPYRAPELSEGEEPTPKSDFYSLGVILYEMLTGVPPFGEGVAAKVAARQLVEAAPLPGDGEISEGTEEIVSRLLEREPEGRYKDASTLVSDMGRVIEGRRPSRSKRPILAQRAAKSSRALAPVLAGILFAIGAVPIGLLLGAERKSDGPSRREEVKKELAAMQPNVEVTEEDGRSADRAVQEVLELAELENAPPDRTASRLRRIEQAYRGTEAARQAKEKAEDFDRLAEEKRKEEEREAALWIPTPPIVSPEEPPRVVPIPEPPGVERPTPARGSLEEVVEKSRGLESERRFGEAARLLEDFARQRAGTSASRRAAMLAQAVTRRAESAFEDEIERARGLAREGRFSAAVEVYETATERFGMPAIEEKAKLEITLLKLAQKLRR